MEDGEWGGCCSKPAAMLRGPSAVAGAVPLAGRLPTGAQQSAKRPRGRGPGAAWGRRGRESRAGWVLLQHSERERSQHKPRPEGSATAPAQSSSSVPGRWDREPAERHRLGARTSTKRWVWSPGPAECRPPCQGPRGLAAGGRGGRLVPAAGRGRRGVRRRRGWVCVHAYLSAGECGCGWPGAELPGSVLPSVLSELALL